jgi:hypothetical protein
VAKQNPTDGYRIIAAWVRRKLGRAVNRKRVLRVMSEHGLIQRRRSEPRRRPPGFFRVERPAQLWHMDMTAVWGCRARLVLPERDHRLPHARNRRLGPRDQMLGGRGDRSRRASGLGAGHPAGDAHARDRQRLRVHGAQVPAGAVEARDRASPWRLPRPRVAGVHRVVVPLAQGALRLAPRVRDPRPGRGGDRRLHRPLPLPPPLGPRLPNPREVRQTWDDVQDALQKAAPEVSTPAGSGPLSRR